MYRQIPVLQVTKKGNENEFKIITTIIIITIISILFYSVLFCYILLIIINKIFRYNEILTSKYELDMNKNINMKEVLLQAKLGWYL